MGVPVIIGKGSHSVYNPPSVQILDTLASLIQTTFPNRGIIINGYGENLGPSVGRIWTPQAVANWIKAKNVWIDYCGWPMYRYVSATGSVNTVAQSGFQQFAQAIGYPTLANATFEVTPGSSVGLGEHYPFERGLKLQGSLDGIYINRNTFRAGIVPNVLTNNMVPLTASGYCACFALQPDPPQGGIYFYAEFMPNGIINHLRDLIGGGPNYVPESVYAQFIQMVARGQANGATGIQYLPLKGIHSQFHPPAPKSTVPTFNGQGNLACGAGFHLVGKNCVPDTPGTKSTTPPKKSSGGGASTPPPNTQSPTPWYDRSSIRTGMILGGFALGGVGIAVGTRQLLAHRERRGY